MPTGPESSTPAMVSAPDQMPKRHSAAPGCAGEAGRGRAAGMAISSSCGVWLMACGTWLMAISSVAGPALVAGR